MKRVNALLLLVAFCLFVSVVHGQSGKPKMVIDQDTFDAGQMYKTGEKIEHAFVIKNSGTADLTIFDARPG